MVIVVIPDNAVLFIVTAPIRFDAVFVAVITPVVINEPDVVLLLLLIVVPPLSAPVMVIDVTPVRAPAFRVTLLIVLDAPALIPPDVASVVPLNVNVPAVAPFIVV
jgi:hypothetical protein